jgi:outer membrane protein TolC
MGSRAGWIALLVAFLLATRPAAKAQQATPRSLTLQEAISLALKQNLSVRIASAQVDEARGTLERRRSSLLPHVNGDALANRENIDLAALGISFPQVPMVVRPFNHYDFRVSGSQSLIDRRAYHAWRASERQD